MFDFESRIVRIPIAGCWIWTGSLTSAGYSRARIDGRYLNVHRWMYEQQNGKVDRKLVMDHLCRVRCCVNPYHLEPVTDKVNCDRGISPAAENGRKERCKRGHEFEPVMVRKNGQPERFCRQCALERAAKYRAERGAIPRIFKRKNK